MPNLRNEVSIQAQKHRSKVALFCNFRLKVFVTLLFHSKIFQCFQTDFRCNSIKFCRIISSRSIFEQNKLFRKAGYILLATLTRRKHQKIHFFYRVGLQIFPRKSHQSSCLRCSRRWKKLQNTRMHKLDKVNYLKLLKLSLVNDQPLVVMMDQRSGIW